MSDVRQAIPHERGQAGALQSAFMPKMRQDHACLHKRGAIYAFQVFRMP